MQTQDITDSKAQTYKHIDYTPNGRVESVTDSKNNTDTVTTYDQKGNRTKETQDDHDRILTYDRSWVPGTNEEHVSGFSGSGEKRHQFFQHDVNADGSKSDKTFGDNGQFFSMRSLNR